MKEKLIEKYGKVQAESLLSKYSEDEIFEYGFLVKEYPKDENWASKIKEFEAKIKDLTKELGEKSKHITKLNEENAKKRNDKVEIEATQNELKTELDALKLSYNEIVAKNNNYETQLKEFESVIKFKNDYEAKETSKKSKLLEQVPAELRDAYAKLDSSEIELLQKTTVSQPKTSGLEGSTAQSDFHSQFDALFN